MSTIDQNNNNNNQWALFSSPETCLFTGEFTFVNAHSFRYQRETGPAFMCQFGWSFSDFGSTSDEIVVGGVLPVHPPPLSMQLEATEVTWLCR